MDHEIESSGRFDAHYVAFVAALGKLRPRLHRYCARMTGSVFDGEDLAQEAIFEAYRKLDLHDPSLPLAPWVTRIAHNRCIDFLRRRKTRGIVEHEGTQTEEAYLPEEPTGPWIGRALEELVTALPPKERACILLKDVFDYSLAETAELVGSSVGGVKAALKRGREKLAARPEPASTRRGTSSDIYPLYAERFNRRDWDAVRALISDDAKLRIGDIYAGRIDNRYLTTFEAMPFPFRMVQGEVDGEDVLMLLGGLVAGDMVSAVIRFECNDDKIARIRHYTRTPWLLRLARRITVEGKPRTTAPHAYDEGMLA